MIYNNVFFLFPDWKNEPTDPPNFQAKKANKQTNKTLFLGLI